MESSDESVFDEQTSNSKPSMNESSEVLLQEDSDAATADDSQETIEINDMSGLPNKCANQLTKSEILTIIKAEKRLERPFFFAVAKAGTCFVFLNYNRQGAKELAMKEKPCRFVRCTTCNDLMKYPGGHLARHESKHQSSSSKPSALSCTPTLSMSSFLPEELTKPERSKIAGLLANYALDSGVAFRALESDPIQKLVVELINFGARRKRPVTLDSILPCRTTIANHTTLEANARIATAKGLVQPYKEHGGAISLDYGKRVDDYLVVMCSFIESGADGRTKPFTRWRRGSVSKNAEPVLR